MQDFGGRDLSSFFKHLFRIAWVGFAVAAPHSSAMEIKAQCTTSVGRALDNGDPGTSFALEPKIALQTSEAWTFKYYSLIDRPLDPYEDFSIPSIDLSTEYSYSLSETLSVGGFGQTSAVDILRWGTDGWISRVAAGPWVSWQVTPYLRLESSAAPFAQFSQYRTRADGEAFSVMGMAEEVKAVLELGQWAAEVSVYFIQSRKRHWRNEYYSFQQLSFTPWKHLTVGISHQLSDEVVSLSTGLPRPFGLFDGRLSRFSGFLRWTI